MNRLILCLFTALLASGQQAEPGKTEEDDLRRSVGEAGTSPVEFIQALEQHLARYPQTTRRAELERALAKAAIEAKDSRRVILYGEKILAREPDDLLLLERVTRALLSDDARDRAERALKYARRFGEVLRTYDAGNKEPSQGGRDRGKMREEVDRGYARALVFEARATGNLGKLEEAVELARRSYQASPNAESAREAGRWLARLGRYEEAVRAYADAFSIADPATVESDRLADRKRMGELYSKLKSDEKGLGDVILQAYDRTTAQLAARDARLRQYDPNAQLTDPMTFTLSGLNGDRMEMASLKGKVLVLDFWATWCGPCRVQKPLYDEVKRRFSSRPEVVFLNITTDEDRAAVEPFLERQQWSKRVYFEDGLAALLKVNSIPTTVIFDKRGQVVSRLNGFLPDRFVDMLSDRIRRALQE